MVILLFLWSRSVLLVMLGSVTYLWSPGKLAGCWMFPGGLNHMTGDWQAWLILKWTGSPHVQVVSHFLAGYFSFVCMGLSDFQACTEWTLFQLSTCVTFANIPWTKASHMVKFGYRVEKKNSISWSEELQHFFAKGHAHREGNNLGPLFATYTVS